jgi:hypothetical protein
MKTTAGTFIPGPFSFQDLFHSKTFFIPRLLGRAVSVSADRALHCNVGASWRILHDSRTDPTPTFGGDLRGLALDAQG